MEKVTTSQIKLEKSKTDDGNYQIFKIETENILLKLENGLDNVTDKSGTLENWIDIYMPLKLQH